MKSKKNKLTNFLKIGILLFGISILLWNCEKDIEINEFQNISDNKKLDYTLEKLSYSELITDQEIEKSLPEIKQRFSKNKKRKTESKKTTQVSEHFTIITDSIHKIITKDVITWSFKIETPVLKNSDFENFLVKKHNEEFSYFLVSYEKDIETVYKKATSYPISKKFLNLDNLNLAKRGDYFMPDDGDGGGGGCSGKLVFGRCSVGGEANGHGPALQWDGVTRCSGSPFLYIDFTHCRNAGMIDLNDIPNYNTPDNNNTQNGDSGLSNNGGSSSSGGTTITNPVTLECDNCSNSFSLISHLNLTDQAQINWVNDDNNSLNVKKLFNFGKQNQWYDEANEFVKSATEILSLPELLPINNIDTFKNKILNITSNLKQWGNPEDEIFAEYVESLVQDFDKMTVGDVYDIYKLTDKQSKILIWKYVAAVIVPIAESAYPFVVYAVTEATLGAALPLLSRIPIAMVIRGARLNKMVRQVGLLGVKQTNTVRILTTSNPLQKAEGLFATLTKNAISKTSQSNGAIVANMGSGNFITFRPLSASSSGFKATINPPSIKRYFKFYSSFKIRYLIYFTISF